MAKGDHSGSDRRRPAFRDWADAVAKLAAAGAIVWGAYIANTFQGKSTAVKLLSEREQAETQLRASMFSDLIQPIVGADVTKIDVKREQLLAQLLALNFHEHFEFKPLLLRVDERLKAELSGQALDERLGQLRGMMRRVISRQVNMLISASEQRETDKGVIHRVRLQGELEPTQKSCTFRTDACAFQQRIVTTSPDDHYKLHVYFSDPDWQDESVRVNATLFPSHATVDDFEPYSVDFRLTWYDLPFTDHTLLADGTRFAFFLDNIDADTERATVGLVWFPKNYFTPRERPIDFSDFREQLGLELEAR